MKETRILNSRGELTNKEKYQATIGGDTIKMQDVRDIVYFSKWVLLGEKDTDKPDSEEKRILVVYDDSGQVYGTVSDTFIRQFMDCVTMFEDEFKAFSVDIGTAKSGRDFIKCVYED